MIKYYLIELLLWLHGLFTYDPLAEKKERFNSYCDNISEMAEEIDKLPKERVIIFDLEDWYEIVSFDEECGLTLLIKKNKLKD
jgi:hypothetical protein